ncbi:hypothetical protein EI94DRAFT_1703484 [Lactarius quietus]|nr:hypothetical protein EI94DRAFT_1703484 [Lactarius quietus]
MGQGSMVVVEAFTRLVTANFKQLAPLVVLMREISKLSTGTEAKPQTSFGSGSVQSSSGQFLGLDLDRTPNRKKNSQKRLSKGYLVLIRVSGTQVGMTGSQNAPGSFTGGRHIMVGGGRRRSEPNGEPRRKEAGEKCGGEVETCADLWSEQVERAVERYTTDHGPNPNPDNNDRNDDSSDEKHCNGDATMMTVVWDTTGSSSSNGVGMVGRVVHSNVFFLYKNTVQVTLRNTTTLAQKYNPLKDLAISGLGCGPVWTGFTSNPAQGEP